MTFIDYLETKIQSLYYTILNKKHLFGKASKTLNCNSFKVIIEEIKIVINDGLIKGFDVIKITNNIIFNLLICNFFVFENHEMAALIGYIYLKRQGVIVKNYSLNGLTNNSTLEQIKIITASWL